MKKLVLIVISIFFLLETTSLANAFTFDPTRRHHNSHNRAFSKYNSNIYNNYNFYKKPIRRGHYASTARPYKNPYPRDIKDSYLQELEKSVYYRVDRAPTGNYPRRAYMINK